MISDSALTPRAVKHTMGAHAVRLAALIAAHEDMPALYARNAAFASHLERDALEEDNVDAGLEDMLSPGAVGLRRTEELQAQVHAGDDRAEEAGVEGTEDACEDDEALAEPAISSEDYLF